MEQVKYWKIEVIKERSLLMHGVWVKMLFQAVFQSKNTIIFILRMKTTLFLDMQRNTQHLIRANLRWFFFSFSFSCLKMLLTSFGLNRLDPQTVEVVKGKFNFVLRVDFLVQWYDSKYRNFEEFKNILPIVVSEEVWANIEQICCQNTDEWRIFCCSLNHCSFCIYTKFSKSR
jgi:hypothetical protein